MTTAILQNSNKALCSKSKTYYTIRFLSYGLRKEGLLAQEQALDMVKEKETQEKEVTESQAQQAPKKAERSHTAYASLEDARECTFTSM